MNSTDNLNTLHPKLRADAITAYNEAVKETPAGVHPVIDECYRSFERSDDLYNLGRTVKNPDGYDPIKKPMGDIVSDAKGGTSWHNFGLALDFHLVINGADYWPADYIAAAKDANWMTVVNIFKKHGYNWGGEFPGTFKDAPHLENKLGKTLTQLNDLRSKKAFIPGTEYVNI